MIATKLCISLILLLGSLALAACKPGAQELAPVSTEAPLAATPIPRATNTPPPIPTLIPSATPIPPTATITLSPEQPVTSLDELLGVWHAYWSDKTTLEIEFIPSHRAVITFMDGTLIGRDTFSIAGGLLTWESVDESLDVPTACAANPVATYQVFITRRGDQPVSLRFALVGEDACVERSLLFDGQVLKWEGP